MISNGTPQAPDTAAAPNFGNSMSPEKTPGIHEAWKAAVAEVGEPDWDTTAAEENAAAREEEIEAPAAEEPVRGKDGKFVKAKAAKAGEAEEPTEDDDKTPAETPDAKKKDEPEVSVERQRLAARAGFLDRKEAKITRRAAELETNYRQQYAQIQQHVQRLSPLQSALELFAKGDPDGFAAKLAEATGAPFKDWNGLQNEMLNAISSPLYRELREERRIREERDRQYETDRTTHETRAAQAAQRQAEIDFKQQMLDELSEDEDPAFADIAATNPQLAEHMFTLQKAYHAQHDEVMPTREALVATLGNVAKQYKQWAAFASKHADSPIVQKLFGVAQTTETNGTRKAETSETRDRAPAPEKRGAGAPKNVSHTRGASPSASVPASSEDIIKHFTGVVQRDLNRSKTYTLSEELGD